MKNSPAKRMVRARMRKWLGGVGGEGDGRKIWEVDSMVCADERPEREGHEEVRETKARNVPIGP